MAIPFLNSITVSSPNDGLATPVLITVATRGSAGIYAWNNNPNGAVTANEGSICLDMRATGSVWKKETGKDNQGWVELGEGGGGPIGAIYSEVADWAARPAFAFDGQLVKTLKNQVTYIEYESTWKIFAMHSTGPASAFDLLNVDTSELELGQQFTSLETNVTVVWRGAGTGWINEGP